jgi:UDP-glucose 4-epimerase
MALKGEDITIYGDGSQTRTFCFINDNIDACYETLVSESCINDVVNIGGNDEITILQLAKEIIEITGSSSNIIHLPPLPEGDMTRRLPDISKMQTLLKRERTTFRDGLSKVIKYFKELK